MPQRTMYKLPSIKQFRSVDGDVNSEAFPELGFVILDGHQRLTDNWSDEGSFAPSKSALEHSKILLEKFPSGLPLPAPTLSNEGEVGFYWGSDNGYISIAIEEDGTCSIYSKNLNTGYYNFEDNLTVTDLSKGKYESLICLL